MTTAKKLPLEEEVTDQIEVSDDPLDTYPPETSTLLSWAALTYIRAPSSFMLMISVVIISVSFIAVLLLSTVVQKDVTISTSGQMLTDAGIREALTGVAGQISEIRKKEGDLVSAGEVIATTGMDSDSERLINLSISALKELDEKFKTSPRPETIEFRLPPLPVRQTVAGSALDAVLALEQQAKFFTDLRMRQTSGQGLETLPLRRRAQVLEDKINSIRRSKQKNLLGLYLESTEEELGRLKNQLEAAENESKLKVKQGLGEFLRSLQAAISQLESYLKQREIRAPIEGNIARIYVKPNAYLEIGKAFALITPKDSRLRTAIHVSSRDIAKVNTGKPIRYKVEAYPYQTYGSFTGTVSSFDQAKDSGLAEADKLGEYVVYGTIDFPQNLNPELREKIRLVVGMKFNADILVERKSISSLIKDWVFFGKH